MILEEVVVAKLQQLPENERQKLLVLIDAWIEQPARLIREISNEQWRLSEHLGNCHSRSENAALGRRDKELEDELG